MDVWTTETISNTTHVYSLRSSRGSKVEVTSGNEEDGSTIPLEWRLFSIPGIEVAITDDDGDPGRKERPAVLSFIK